MRIVAAQYRQSDRMISSYPLGRISEECDRATRLCICFYPKSSHAFPILSLRKDSNSPRILARSHSHAKSKQLSRPCGFTGESSARVYQQAGNWFLSITDAENYRTHPHLIHMQMALSQLNATLVCSPSPPMTNYDDKLGIASGRVIAYVQRSLVA